MSRHLITGGAGFIGSALAHRLVREGHQVTVLDRFSRGKAERLPAKALQIKGDIRSAKTVFRAINAADVVWHLAYVQGTQTFYADPKDVIDVALCGIMNVLSGCEIYEDKELILVSSSEVYQNPPAKMFPTDETVPLSVPDVTNPRYSYGGGKIASEIATLAYSQADILKRAVIVRPHNIYGPDMGYEHVIPEFAVRMMDVIEGRSGSTILTVGDEILEADKLEMTVEDYIKHGPLPFQIQGTGKETRSFCYIDDCIDAMMLLFKHGEDRNVYHLGNPAEEHTIEELAYYVADWFDTKVEVVPGQLPKGSPTRRKPSIEKLATLGYKPQIPLKEGLAATLDWYKTARETERLVKAA